MFEPARCGVDDLSVGVAVLTCLIIEAQSQANGNAPGMIYEGALEFVNNEFDIASSQQGATVQNIPFSVSGEAGDIFFLSADIFIFANNGGFGDSRTTLTFEFDNPELVEAFLPLETFVPAPQLADIDVRPFSRKNRLRPGSRGFVPVAVLGSEEFDALQVKTRTVRFGPGQARPAWWSPRTRDINRDGFVDLVLFFRTRNTGIQCGDTEAELAGATHLGDSFVGIDSITTKGCD